MKLDGVVTSALSRLDDDDAVVWSRDEMNLYVIDGYDQFCRRTRCLFELFVIENRPRAGNWTTDLERYFAEQSPGMGLTDDRLNFTSETERDLPVGGAVGGSLEGPTPMTSPADTTLSNMTFKVDRGRLPNSTVEILRVTWDELELIPEGSADMRYLDTQYQTREAGDPTHFTMDKDGLLTIRITPPARADADYATVVGAWGTMTQTTRTVTVVGSWGILRESSWTFPSNGPHGTPSRQHPATKNIVVEIARLGKSLLSHAFEIPDSYIKYVEFWAMSMALKKDGPGQDLKLSKHYAARFEVGISRAGDRTKKIQKEYVLRMGSQGDMERPFEMGDPQLPYPYGPKGKIE